ncbi:MAG: TonB-dependent receptor [Veillonellales bacterium]
MRKHLLRAAILAGLLVSSPTAFAEETPSFNFEEIVIQADSYQTPVDSSTVNVKVVSPGKASTIPEILRFSAGIDIQERSIAGDNQDGTVKLRGYDARRFTVMLNGRPINTAGVMGGQYIDWTTIPLNTVEKIQIVKGGKLASDGNTLGGTINIITKSKGADGGEINILGGSNGRYDYMFQYNGNVDKLHYQITTDKTGADAYLRNNDYDADQYGLRLNYDVTAKDNLEFGVNHTKSRRGYIIANTPGSANYDPSYPVSSGDGISPGIQGINLYPGSYWDKTNNYYDFTYHHQTTDGQWALAYWRNDERRHEIIKNQAGAVTLDRTIISDKSDSFKFSGDKTVNGSKYGYGLEYKQLRYGYGWYDTRPVNGSDIYPSQKINLFGAYIDDTWQLDKRWTGYVGLRYDQFDGSKDDTQHADNFVTDQKYNSLSPKFNFSFRNNKDTTTFLSVNRLWRSPSMAEFYWWAQNYNTAASWAGPNPGYHHGLKPESGYSYEIGSQHRFSGNYTSKLTFYYQDINDYINFAHNYPYYCYNIDQAKIWGAEWENDIKLDAHNSLILNYTNEHATQNDKDLDYRPHHKANLSYLYDAKPWQAEYTVSFAGKQSDSTSGTVKNLGGYTIHNFSLTRQLDEQRSVSFYVDNIFDRQYVEEIGYPMPGRSYYVSFKQKI